MIFASGIFIFATTNDAKGTKEETVYDFPAKLDFAGEETPLKI